MVLLNSYSHIISYNLELVKNIIQYVYDKFAIPSLQVSATMLFRSISKEGSRLIASDPEFASKWSDDNDNNLLVDTYFQQHKSIPQTLSVYEQCTVGYQGW